MIADGDFGAEDEALREAEDDEEPGIGPLIGKYLFFTSS